jgi:septum formation protein
MSAPTDAAGDDPGHPIGASPLARPPALILASSSPRRRELLGRLGVAFSVRVPDIDETPRPGEAPPAYVERLARAKAVEGREHAEPGADEVVVAADTTVDVDGSIVGKPADRREAVAMLMLLSGRHHLVHTGVAVARGPRLVSSVTTSTVRFETLDRAAIDDYVATGQPYDKAGGYSLTGVTRPFVAAVEGSASNVLGLPMAQLEALLASVGVEPVTWGPPRTEPGSVAR